MVWYSHLLKNFPQFIVIHTVKGFGIVNKAEIDVFLELSCFFYDPRSKRLLISWLQSPSAVILEPKKIKSITVSIVFPSICHEVIGLDAMILVFEC